MKLLHDLQVPESWSEINYSKAIKILKADEVELIDILFGEGTADRLTFIQANEILSELSFIDDLSIFNLNEPKEEYKHIDVGSIPFGSMKKIEGFFQAKDSSGFEAMGKAMPLIIGKEIWDEPVTEWIGTVNFFLSKLIRSLAISQSLKSMSPHKRKYWQELIGSSGLEYSLRFSNSPEKGGLVQQQMKYLYNLQELSTMPYYTTITNHNLNENIQE